MTHYKKIMQDERGVVSLLTVIFFMIFVSLIVMGFIALVINDNRQTTDNDLSASAFSAAQGGVEEGKRVLLYCQSIKGSPSYATSGCGDVLNQTNCNAFTTGNGSTLATALDIDIQNNEGITGGTGAQGYQQYFSCLTITTDTPYISATLSKDSDYIQQLKTKTAFQQLKLSWSGSGLFASRAGTLASWPTLSSWGTSRYMPVIQLQVIPFPPSGDLNLDTIEHDSTMAYIVPCLAGNVVCDGSNRDKNTLDYRDAIGVPSAAGMSAPITYASCTTDGSTSYQCSGILTGFNGGNVGGTQYYVRAKLLYGDKAEFEIAPQDGGGTSVAFDNVQPWIDATGRTNDVFRRVRSQVSYALDLPLPQNALEAAGPVCKDMVVTALGATSVNNCGP